VLWFISKDLTELCKIPRCFLGRYNIFKILGQMNGSRWTYIAARPSWYIIKDNRKFRCLRDCFVMLIDAFLCWFVIVWRNRKDRSIVKDLKGLDLLHDFIAVVSTNSSYQWNTLIN